MSRSAARPAPPAVIRLVRGGRRGLAAAFDHLTRGRGGQLVADEAEPATLPPEALAALTAALERSTTRQVGAGAAEVGPDEVADWLAAGLGTSERRTAALGAVVTVGKGLSALAAAADAYVATAASLATTRMGADGSQRVAIDPASVRASISLHTASAAGEPHFHTHVLLGATGRVAGDPRWRAIDTAQFLAGPALEAGTAARIAALAVLREHGLEIDPLSMDLAGLGGERVERLEELSTMSGLVRTAAEAGRLGHDAAWRAARQAVSSEAGTDPLAPVLDPVAAAVRDWASVPFEVRTAGPDGSPRTVRFQLSAPEALEHAVDALGQTGAGRAAIRDWLDARTGGRCRALAADLARVASRARSVELADYVRGLAEAADAGATITRDAITSHAQVIASHHAWDFAEVEAALSDAFVELPGRRGLVATATIAADLDLAERARAVLTDATSVEAALDAPSGLSVIQGVAGAGKTRAVAEAAARTWAHERRPIYTLSRNALTARELGDAVRQALADAGGDPARVRAVPLARMAREEPVPGTRVIVDEFALSERADLSRLMDWAAIGPVTLLGDTHQQRAIASPTAAQTIAAVADAAGQARLAETVRCAAWRDLHDDLRAAPTDDAARERAVAALEVMAVGSAEEAARVAQRAGAVLLARSNALAAEAAGAGERPHGPTAVVRRGVEVGVGREVVFRKIVRDAGGGYLAVTGQVGRVAEIGPGGLAIEIAETTGPRRVVIDADTARKALAPADALTIDSAQGRTVERAAVLLTGGEDAHALYSAATRGRRAPLILVLDHAGEGAAGTRAVDTRDDAARAADARQVVADVLARSERGGSVATWDQATRRAVAEQLAGRDPQLAARLDPSAIPTERTAEVPPAWDVAAAAERAAGRGGALDQPPDRPLNIFERAARLQALVDSGMSEGQARAQMVREARAARARAREAGLDRGRDVTD